jgi:hypothetical protein
MSDSAMTSNGPACSAVASDVFVPSDVAIEMKAKSSPATAPKRNAVVRSTPKDFRNPGEQSRRSCLAFSAALTFDMMVARDWYVEKLVFR